MAVLSWSSKFICYCYHRYQFDVTKLGEYHEMNQQRGKQCCYGRYKSFTDYYGTAKEAMRHGVSPIIIDNTNTMCHEMKPYVVAVSDMHSNTFDYVVIRHYNK